MEDPVAEIPKVIRLLTQSPPSLQETAIDQFFTPSAEFVHPFCRVWSYSGSRWAVKKIFQWYKIMSPHIDLEIQSVAYDKENLKLYVTVFQIFSIWLVPFYAAPVTLTTVLDLTTDPGEERTSTTQGNERYYIRKQEDLYQTSEFIKFVMPLGGHFLVMMWHTFASLFSVVGVFALWPIMWAEDRGYFNYSHSRAAREGLVGELNSHVPDLKAS
ncbi:uncharacterized protein BJX67DRAFT_319312 [Aspergillus lucknowensis]|uniref:SigF-like NTF2-like domain-containing protein n=1 Tax=Aspergillus lucknowensis TaxID=176173 RepID=A0ABR4LYU7_9EURO